MKRYVIILLVIGLLSYIGILERTNRKLQDSISILKSNEKAFLSEIDSLQGRNIVYKLTVDQLKSTNDSISCKIREVLSELKIKDRKLKGAGYIKEVARTNDTIIISDTIFKNPEFRMDTVIKNNWYCIDMGLYYPDTISLNISFSSEKYIVTSIRKETVNRPKRFFIARWFQRKHEVLVVDVIEKNPHISIQKQRFIKIIK